MVTADDTSAVPGPFGVWLNRRRFEFRAEAARRIEAAGYATLWVGGSPGGELPEPRAMLESTTTLQLATGVVNVWRDDAPTIARSAGELAAGFGERFLLGVGVGHPEATSDYAHPYRALSEYLDGLAEHGFPAERTVLAALGPRVLRLARDRTRGAHPYLTTPEHTRLARELLGPGSLLAPEQKIVLDEDVDRARATARDALANYLRLGNYLANLRRLGFDDRDLADGGSDRLVDALALHGTPESIAAGLRAHLDAGADQIAIQPLGDDPIGDLERLAPHLRTA